MKQELPDDDARFAALLRRWLSGDFTRRDEQALQQLVAKDAFLREAWEGFAGTPAAEHQAALERLRKRLPQKARLGRSQLVWRSAAAAGALLVAATYWWWSNKPLLDDTSSASAPEISREIARVPEAGDTSIAAAFPSSSPSEPSPSAPRVSRLPTPKGKSPLEWAASHNHREDDNSILEMPPADSSKALFQQITPEQPLAFEVTEPPAEGQPSSAQPALNIPETRPLSADRVAYHRPEANEPFSRTMPKARKEDLPTVISTTDWTAFWEAFHKAAFLTDLQPNGGDTLRILVLVDEQGKANIITIEPPLSYSDRQRLQDLLHRYRWMPRGQRGLIYLPTH